ncbi:MAG TPA: glutaminase, partial [Gammaproteobacteria bacterium]|nr:glutaminase [Gammaproteobacteria bacterium]
MDDYQGILEQIFVEAGDLLGRGKVADYIPALAEVSPRKFGMAIHTVTGEDYGVGDWREPFSVQSISKLFTLTLTMGFLGEAIFERVGREPSGNPFNSLVQLEYENGIPRNPFINAGALVLT